MLCHSLLPPATLLHLPALCCPCAAFPHFALLLGDVLLLLHDIVLLPHNILLLPSLLLCSRHACSPMILIICHALCSLQCLPYFLLTLVALLHSPALCPASW
jgi:hypothetical protein